MPEYPKSVTGGCLCEAVRYTLSFPDESSWPPGRHTCQCTQCRKWSGALMAPLIDVKASHMTYTSHYTTSTSSPLSLQSYTEYSATPGCYRGFCKTCGSTLLWRSDSTPEEVEIMTGTLDEDVLRGQWGKTLAEPADGHCWAKNAVIGVTDREGLGKGKFFMEGSASEEVKG